MRNAGNKKNIHIMIYTLIAIMSLSIGYASISAVNLVINGNAIASEDSNNFSVRFLSNQEYQPNVSPNPESKNQATVTGEKTATFDITSLTKEGDTAVATYKIKNNSEGIGANISLNITNSNDEYFQATATVLDSELQAKDETEATITVELLKTVIEDNVTATITATLVASPIEDELATGSSPKSKIAGSPENFETDSWEIIQKAVKNNNTGVYNIGDTKEVTINNKNYTLRLVNKNTNSAFCNNTSNSQTACGFVIEFVDAVTIMGMNYSEIYDYDSATNVGGYPETDVHTYLNTTLYNNLPSDLKSVIAETRVISGFGSSDTNNFTTNDKLYLLSGKEIFNSSINDTAGLTTNQLAYYSSHQVTSSSNYQYAIKQYNGSNEYYWLRYANSVSDKLFGCVDSDGYWCSTLANYPFAIAPAFRIKQ